MLLNEFRNLHTAKKNDSRMIYTQSAVAESHEGVHTQPKDWIKGRHIYVVHMAAI